MTNKYYRLSTFMVFTGELERLGFVIERIYKGLKLFPEEEIYTSTLITFETVPKDHLILIESLRDKFDLIFKYNQKFNLPSISPKWYMFCDTGGLYYNG